MLRDLVLGGVRASVPAEIRLYLVLYGSQLVRAGSMTMGNVDTAAVWSVASGGDGGGCLVGRGCRGGASSAGGEANTGEYGELDDDGEGADVVETGGEIGGPVGDPVDRACGHTIAVKCVDPEVAVVGHIGAGEDEEAAGDAVEVGEHVAEFVHGAVEGEGKANGEHGDDETHSNGIGNVGGVPADEVAVSKRSR